MESAFPFVLFPAREGSGAENSSSSPGVGSRALPDPGKLGRFIIPVSRPWKEPAYVGGTSHDSSLPSWPWLDREAGILENCFRNAGGDKASGGDTGRNGAWMRSGNPAVNASRAGNRNIRGRPIRRRGTPHPPQQPIRSALPCCPRPQPTAPPRARLHPRALGSAPRPAHLGLGGGGPGSSA